MATLPLSKRKQKSAARLQEFQQRRRLLDCRLRKVALQVLKRVRFERRWRVFHEWRAAAQLSDPACDGAGQTTTLKTTSADG